MKFIDEMLELEDRTHKNKQDSKNALTVETASSPTAYRLLTKAALRGLKDPQQEQNRV